MNNYNLGGGGVNIVKNPTQLADNELTRAKNAEYHPDEGTGGEGAITKRGGLAKLFAEGLGGAILGMIGLALDEIPAPPAPSGWVPDDTLLSLDDSTNMTNTAVGAASLHAAVADYTSDDSYVRFQAVVQGVDSGVGTALRFSMTDITTPDPGKTHTIRIRARRNVISSPQIDSTDVYFTFWDGVTTTVKSITLLKSDFDSAGADWVTYEYVLSAGEVSALEGIGYDNLECWIVTDVFRTGGSGIPEEVNIDIAGIWIDIED